MATLHNEDFASFDAKNTYIQALSYQFVIYLNYSPMITCPKCGTLSLSTQKNCVSCQASLAVSLEDLQQLRDDLKQLKEKFEWKSLQLDVRITELEQRINAETQRVEAEVETPVKSKDVYADSFNKLYELEAEFFEIEGETVEDKPENVEGVDSGILPVSENFPQAEEAPQSEEKEIIPSDLEKAPIGNKENEFDSNEEPVQSVFQKEITSEQAVAEAESITEEEQEILPELSPVEPPKPSRVSIALTSLLTETIFAPLAQFKEYFTDIYLHYKKQNKLPVFFMTVGGVLALLFGFGYLMQYADSFYFELTKTIGGFASAAGVIWWGKRLMRNYERYDEFGSALFGLGISLNYLMLYFLADSVAFPIFGSVAVALIMVLANTLLATWLAMKYETKVVAIVSLLGGAFTPFYLNSSLVSPFYFVYLWMLCVATIFLAERIRWKALGTLAFLVSSIVLELVVWDWASELSLPIFTVIFHAFAYLFIYYALFERKTPKFELIREEVVVLAISISLLLLNLYLLYQSHGVLEPLGAIYLINAALWLGGFFWFRSQLPKRMHLLFFVLAGTFVGLAVPVLFGQELMGLFWALEGITLVACGFIFGMASVRKEGFLVMLIAIGKICLTFPEILASWEVNIWHFGFVNYLVLGVIMLVIRALLYKFRLELRNYEKHIATFLSESISVWAWGAWFMLSWHYLGISTYNFALIPMLLLAWWGNKQQLKVTEWLGLANFAFFFFGFVESASVVNSFRFGEQTLLGKISMLEIFLPLWGLQFFYEKLMPNSKSLKIMKTCRELFYISLPWIWLRALYRNAPDFLPMGFFASTVVSFTLSELLKKKDWVFAKGIIRNQGYIGFALALLACFVTLPVMLMQFETSLWNWGFVNLLLVGGILGGLKAYLDKVRTDISAFEKELSKILLEAVSIWGMCILLLVSYFYVPVYTALIGLLAMFGWLWWAQREKLPFTEMLALGHFGLAILALIHNCIDVESASFMLQNLGGKLLMLASFAMLWLLPKFSGKIAPQIFVSIEDSETEEGGGEAQSEAYHLRSHDFLQLLHPLFYLLIPIITLPTIWERLGLSMEAGSFWLMPNHFSLAVWGAMLVAFILHEWRKHDSLNLELHVLALVGTIVMIMQVNYFSVGLGLALLLGMLFYKKGLQTSAFTQSKYKVLFGYTFYFVALCLALIYADLVSPSDAVAILAVPSVFLYLIVHFREKLPPMKGHVFLAYRLANVLHIFGVIVIVAFLTGKETSIMNLIVSVVTIVASSILQGISVYNRERVYPASHTGMGWKVDVVVFHLFCIAGYAGIGNIISVEWNGVVLTVLLTIHSIILLFNSAKRTYKFLMRFAIGLFVLAAIKLKFYDMANFTAVKQIIVLMVVGVLLLIGANLFARIRKNLEEEGEDLTDEVIDDGEDNKNDI